MGMIKGCFGTNTLEFFGANLDFFNTDIIVKIGNSAVRHLILAFGLANADIVGMNKHSMKS